MRLPTASKIHGLAVDAAKRGLAWTRHSTGKMAGGSPRQATSSSSDNFQPKHQVARPQSFRGAAFIIQPPAIPPTKVVALTAPPVKAEKTRRAAAP